jgi:hypothetical protein
MHCRRHQDRRRSSWVGQPWEEGHLQGDVCRALAVEAVLRCVLGVVQVQTTHVELLSHDGVVDVVRG